MPRLPKRAFHMGAATGAAARWGPPWMPPLNQSLSIVCACVPVWEGGGCDVRGQGARGEAGGRRQFQQTLQHTCVTGLVVLPHTCHLSCCSC